MKIKIILNTVILIFIFSCSNQQKLANNDEKIWCLSQEDYVTAGSVLNSSGLSEVTLVNGPSFSEESAQAARELHNTLLTTVIYYEYEGRVVFQDSLQQIAFDKNYVRTDTTFGNEDMNLYEFRLTSRKIGSTGWTNDVDWLFNLWNLRFTKPLPIMPEEGIGIKEVEAAAKEGSERLYQDLFGICKIWYDLNN